MRRQLQEIAEGARDGLLDWYQAMQKRSGLSDEEALIRYQREHRNRPDQILRYVQRAIPDGEDVLDAAVEYERTMESTLKQRRRQHAD